MNTKNSSIAHVEYEKLQSFGEGMLEFSSVNGKGSGRIILDSVKFFLLQSDGNTSVIGESDDNGIIFSSTKKLGVHGYVFSNGEYKLTHPSGINLISDKVFVSYDYEYDLPI